MNAQQNHIIREITPLSDKDCFYIAERHKKEFTYPIHNHAEFELNFCEKAAGVRRIVGDSTEVIGEYDLVLITGKDLEHVWEQNECNSKEIREITIQFSSDLFFKSFINKNQFDSIRRMLDKAQKGLCFPMSAIPPAELPFGSVRFSDHTLSQNVPGHSGRFPGSRSMPYGIHRSLCISEGSS